jgi:DNA-binding IclR family transcriptional regulator
MGGNSWLPAVAYSYINMQFSRSEEFLRLANQIRAKGYASAPSQVVDGVVDYSAAVLQHDHAICALTVPYIARRASKMTADNAVRQLCRADISTTGSIEDGHPGSVAGFGWGLDHAGGEWPR